MRESDQIKCLLGAPVILLFYHSHREMTFHALVLIIVFIIGPQREKTCLRGFANNTGADQPAHPRSLICAFVICYLESIICKLATGEIRATLCS